MLAEQEFQQTVLTGVESLSNTVKDLKSNQEKILSDYSRLDGATQAAVEDLTKIKNHSNDVDATVKSLQRVVQHVQLEGQAAYGNSIDRLLARPNRREFWNALFRKLVYPQMKLPEEMERAFTGVSTFGATTVPSEYASEIYDALGQYGAYTSLRVMQVGARSVVLPLYTARPSYYWIGAGTGGTAESSAITEGSFTGGSASLAVQTLGALSHVTNELIQDSTVDISGFVLRELGTAIAYGLDYMAFTATGTANQAMAGYYGIFACGTVDTGTVATATAGNTTVAATVLEDYVKCLTTVNAAVLTRPSRWWVHPTILAKMCLVRDVMGRSIFQTMLEAPSPGAIGSILGYPVTLVQAAPSTDAASAKIAVFGDPEGYVVGLRKDLELEYTTALKFAENMTSFRALTRAGGIHRTSTAYSTKPFAVLTLPAA